MNNRTDKYVLAVNKIAEDPNSFPLSEEQIWADYMVALAGNSARAYCTVSEDAIFADDFLYEFRKRFYD